MTTCPVCSHLAAHPADDELSRGHLAQASGCTVYRVRQHRESCAGSLRDMIEGADLDPAAFRVDTSNIRVSKRQSMKDGSWYYSYSAKVTERAPEAGVSAEQIQQWSQALRRSKAAAAPKRLTDGTYLIMLADPQLGKKGTGEAVENWKRAVAGHAAKIRLLKPAAVHVAWMGDEIEGVSGNYTNQLFTVELNLSQQLELDYDLRVWTLRQLAALGLPLSASSVVSNHGEWTRMGDKEPRTTRNDNASTHIARQVQKLFREVEPFGGPVIDWTIGDGAPGVTVQLSGASVYFTHGYVEKGRGAGSEARVKGAMERQILADPAGMGATKLFVAAHYHHFAAQHFEGRTLMMCPALEAEGSSEYMRDQYGVWSTAGSLGFVVSSELRDGWSDMSIQ